MTRADDRQQMGDMESALVDLQEEITLATETPARHFRPWWFLAAIVVAVIVGLSAYTGVTELRRVPENADAIEKNCKVRNDQIVSVNQKFAQLNFLFDTAIKTRPPDQPPPTEEVIRLFEEFKKPIPLAACSDPPLSPVRNDH